MTEAVSWASRVLGLRRGRGRADGSVTRAGEAYFGMLGRQPELRTFDPRQPLVREGAADYVLLQNGQRGLVRRLREDGTYQLTNLGRRFFKNKYSQHVAHIPVVIRGMRRAKTRAGLTSAGTGSPQTSWVERLSEQQILQNVKRETLRLVAAGDEDRAAGRAPIMELSDETYFYEQYRNSRVHVETILRQRLRGLRRVSYAAVLQQYPGMRIRGLRQAGRGGSLAGPAQAEEQVNMEALRDLADDFNVRDRWKLYRLARQRLDVTQAMAFEAPKADVGRQVQAPRPRPASPPRRRGPTTGCRPKYGLVVMDVFTRKAAVESLQRRAPQGAGGRGAQLRGHHGPGQRARLPDRELPEEAVRPEDRNAMAVIDRGAQTLKKDLATRVARKTSSRPPGPTTPGRARRSTGPQRTWSGSRPPSSGCCKTTRTSSSTTRI